MRSLNSVAEDPVALLPPLREVIAGAELAAKKSLGQNFLLDLNLTRRIARSVAGLGEGTVIEVGPGPGGLTRALLLEGAQHVIAIERDSRAVAALQPLVQAAGQRLTLIEGDALQFDYRATQTPRRIVANLPYNIGTPLLIGWLEHSSDFASLTLMFQKEVADRLLAAPGSKTYGRLSVMAQWRCDVQRVMDLPARAFTPPPKVDSSVVSFLPSSASAGEGGHVIPMAIICDSNTSSYRRKPVSIDHDLSKHIRQEMDPGFRRGDGGDRSRLMTVGITGEKGGRA